MAVRSFRAFGSCRELLFFLFSPHLCSSLHRAWRKVSAFFSFCFSHPTTQEIKMSVVSGEAFRQSGHFTFHTHYFAVYSLLSAQLQHLGNDPPPPHPPPSPLLQWAITPVSMIVQSQVKISGGMELIIPRHQDSIPGWTSGRSQSGRLVCVRRACLFIHAAKKAPGRLGTEAEHRLPKNRLVLFILPDTSSYFCRPLQHQRYHSCHF